MKKEDISAEYLLFYLQLSNNLYIMKKTMNCLFIYNPNSGRGKIKKRLNYIRKTLEKKFDVVDVYATQYKGDMERKIGEVCQSKLYDAVVFSGGDGTFNNVLQGLSHADSLPVLGYIPGGTVNDIAHSLKIPLSIRGALRVIVDGRTEKLDCMKINDEAYAMYVVAAGVCTCTPYLTKQTDKKFFGKLAYGLIGFKDTMIFNPFPVKVTRESGTEETNAFLILVLNSRSLATVQMNRNDSMSDGYVEVALVERKQTYTAFSRFLGVCDIFHLFVRGFNEELKGVKCFRTKKVEFDIPENLTWTFDGERGVTGRVTIEVVPRRVEMFVPRKLKEL